MSRVPIPGNGFATRREFLWLSGLGGLSLSNLLRLRADSRVGERKRCRSVIMIMLSGGPSHIDMYDPKPDAPEEFRGPFQTISTKLPGLRFTDLLPMQAAMAEKFTLIRSMKMGFNDHQNQSEILCGFSPTNVGGQPRPPGRPPFGSLVSRFGAPPNNPLPRYVSLSAEDADRERQQDPAYAGAAHRPFVPTGQGLDDMRLSKGMTHGRIGDRQGLLQTFDTLRRDLDVRRDMGAMDEFSQRAAEMLTSDKVRDAFDLTKEPAKVISRYGSPELAKRATKITGGYHWGYEKLVQARRLAEAGVPVITVFFSGWDHHGKIQGERYGVFDKLESMLPAWDRYFSALVSDLHDRGLQDEVAVVAWGEFGRGPRIEQKVQGRDHWPDANFALFAGGGFRHGQVIGETDARAEQVKSRPYTPQNVFATLYQALGIDASQTLPDHQGRPMYLLDDRDPIAELTA